MRTDPINTIDEGSSGGRSLWSDAWQVLRRNRAAMVALIILTSMMAMVVIAPLLSPYSFDYTDWDRISVAPSIAEGHPFGTDALGRDLFVRTLYGGRISLMVGLVATLVSLVIGISYGAIAGYLGGRVDQIMMRIVDILYALPFMFLVILLMVFFGRNILLIFVAIGAINWLDMARIVRGQTLSLKTREFIEAARAGGVSTPRIIRRHIVPNLLGWGALVNEGAREMESSPWTLIFPSLFLAVTLFCFNFIGDGMRDALDPRDRSGQ
jgi:oligopeptide transport system permease protein